MLFLSLTADGSFERSVESVGNFSFIIMFSLILESIKETVNS